MTGPADTRVMVLASGGIDSTACLAYYRSQGFAVQVLWIDYGQPAAKPEQSAVEAVAAHYEVPLRKLRVQGLSWELTPCCLVEYRGRNLALVSLAYSASTWQSGLIALGIHQGTPFLDCTNEFVRNLDQTIRPLSQGCFRLDCPFQGMSKLEVAQFALSNAVPLGLTYSCQMEGPTPCKECPKCQDAAEAWRLWHTKSPSAENGQ